MFYELAFNFTVSLLEKYSYPTVFILSFLEIIFTPLPSEIVLPLAGYVAYKNNSLTTLILSIFLSSLGSTLGSFVLYYIGKVSRGFFFKYGKYFFISQTKLLKAQKFFLEYKEAVLIIGRFVPGIRSLVAIPAGIFEVDKKIFFIYSFIAFSIWSSILILIGYFLGDKWIESLKYSNQIDIIGIIIFISFILYYIRESKKPAYKRRISKKLL